MKKILAIDGGGIRGIIPAYILSEIEARTGQPIAKSFDLIAGTSTGGIIAAGLAVPSGNTYYPRYSAKDLVDFYTEESGKIFEKNCKIRMLFRSRYSNVKLEQVLLDRIGDERFGNMMTKVMIPSYDLTDQRPYFFKSWKHVAGQLPTHRIVAAGCSAPTLFDPTYIILSPGTEAKYIIDGAVCANNPTMCAYVEAKRLWGDEEVFVLSLGTGDVSDPTKPANRNWGAISWLPTISDLFIRASVNTIDYQLNTIEPDMYVRLQRKLEHASDKADDVSPGNIKLLVKEAERICLENTGQLDRIAEMILRGKEPSN